MANEKERFEKFYIPEPNSGCWLWVGGVGKRGYGRFCWEGDNEFKAHRASWILNCGPISNDLHVLHKCDTPICVNPNHLFLGTQADNMADMIAKGRDRKKPLIGSRHNMAKLTEHQIADIRSDMRSQRRIASEHRVSQSAIQCIKSGKTWRHVI